MDETEVKSEKIKSFKKVKRCAIPPGESMTWGDNDEPLVLPADLTPTGPPNCSIMEVSYELSVSPDQHLPSIPVSVCLAVWLFMSFASTISLMTYSLIYLHLICSCTYRHGEEIVHLLQFTVVPRGMFSSMKVRLPITATFGLTQSDRERLAAETSHGNAW